MKVIQATVNNYYMDKKQNEDNQGIIFLAICLIALGVSIIGNVLVDFFSK